MKANPNFVLFSITLILICCASVIAWSKDSTVTMVIIGMVSPTLIGLLAMLRAGDAAAEAATAASKAGDAAMGAATAAVKADHAAVAAAKAVQVVSTNADATKVVQAVQADQLRTIHVLVNDLSTRSLGTIADQAERIAKMSGLEEDIQSATSARRNYDSKVATDQQVKDEQKVKQSDKTVG